MHRSPIQGGQVEADTLMHWCYRLRPVGHPTANEPEAWWLAATNRWLTAEDACAARQPTKLAFCSRFRRQREAPVTERRFLLSAFCELCTTSVSQSTKRPAVKAASLRTQRTYLISALAPASSSFFLASSASALGTASLTGFGAPSTRSLASFRPRPVSSRTALMTVTLFAPTSSQDDVEFGLLFSSGRSATSRPELPQRQQRQQPTRRTSLRMP